MYRAEKLTEAIIKGEYQRDDLRWNSLSTGARDLLTKLLSVDPDKRLNVRETSEHPWMLE
jgi:serine/threonine protein kinase